MIAEVGILLSLTAFFALIAYWCADEGHWIFALFLFCVAIGAGFKAFHAGTPEAEIERRQEATKVATDRLNRETPHVVREVDGCKVYAFESQSRWHYFTRCPGSQTTTDSTHEECRQSGKVRTCEEIHTTITSN